MKKIGIGLLVSGSFFALFSLAAVLLTAFRIQKRFRR